MAAIAPVQPRLHAGPWAPASALQAVVRAVGAATEQSAAGRPFFGAAAGSVPGMRKVLSNDPMAALRQLGSGGGNVKLVVDGEAKEYDTSSGSHKIHPFCEEQGIQFSCIEGTCGTCAVEVKKGADILNGLTEAENSFFAGDAGAKRLACQCQINQGASGEVEVEK
ncbi:hypothetical protein DIPPA_27199 [Diplonema papillatum]|nr:hypothetical protein DIPPA_30029 [Diplonema papillatum]KAJ9467889.1 hypothetical protein DIPPA_27199 [Diplonema papillatum]